MANTFKTMLNTFKNGLFKCTGADDFVVKNTFIHFSRNQMEDEEDEKLVVSPKLSRVESAPSNLQTVPFKVVAERPSEATGPESLWDTNVLRLNKELLHFVAVMQLSSEEVEARKQWVRAIENACRALWPHCQVRVFGSFSTGLSLPDSDVDVAVLNAPLERGLAMWCLAHKMLEQDEISSWQILQSAKVPVAKLRSPSGLKADVVFNQLDGIRTSRFVCERCEEYPQMRHLVVFLKYLLEQRDHHQTWTGGMGSFLLCNVVLHFLQRHPSRRDPHQYAATSLGHYLYDFLKYYGQEFNYDTQAISLLNDGRVFDKSERDISLCRHPPFVGGISLCLESPLDRSIDLGAPVWRMSILRDLFRDAFHGLRDLFMTRAPAKASLLCPLLLDPAHLELLQLRANKATEGAKACIEEGGLQLASISAQPQAGGISEHRTQATPQPQALPPSLSSNSQSLIHRWRADARQLKGNNRHIVSPIFSLVLVPDSANVEFKVMINPKVGSGGKENFQNAHGKAFFQLKCETQLQKAFHVSFRIVCGEEAKRGKKKHHNFYDNAVCSLSKEEELWDFTATAKQQESQTFLVILEIEVSESEGDA